jgi:hypothetical protein
MQAASGGLASMPTKDFGYAQGGIVAFSGASGDQQVGDPTQRILDAIADDKRRADYGTEQEPGWGGTEAPDSTVLSRAEEALNKYMNFAPKEMSEKEQEAFLDRYMARVKKAGGEDIYAPEIARSAQDDADRAKARRVGEANAYFTAAGKILKGRSLAEGASEALPAFGGAMNEVEKLDQAAKTANARAQFALKDAQRKERMGDARGAQAALGEARKFQQDANRAQGDKLRYGADIAARTVGYSKTSGKGANAAKLAERLADAEEAYAMDPSKENKARLNALSSAAAKMKSSTSFSTSENAPNKQAAAVAPVQQRVDAAIAQDIADFKLFSPEGAAYRRAVRAGGTQEAARLLKEAEKGFRATHERTQGLTGAGEAAPGTAGNPIVIK